MSPPPAGGGGGSGGGGGGGEHYCLKWNNYQTNIVQALGNLKLDEDFVDATLSCEGRSIRAHKVVLSACSDYFRDVFRVSAEPTFLRI